MLILAGFSNQVRGNELLAVIFDENKYKSVLIEQNLAMSPKGL